MEAMEVAIYIGIAVITAGIALVFIASMPFSDESDNMKDRILGEETQSFKHVDDMEFLEEVLQFWKDNQWSDRNATLLLYHESAGTISKQSMFRLIKDNNLCLTLQSRSYGCGEREDVIMGSIDLPSIVRLTYSADKLSITPGTPMSMPNRTYRLQMQHLDGFVGNGEITMVMDPIAADADISFVSLEGIFGSDFRLFINDEPCGEYTTTLGPDRWQIPCRQLFTQGTNYARFDFDSDDLYRNYIAGGIFTLIYRSGLASPAAQAKSLPGMNGSINYFGAVDFTGPPQSMRIILDYSLGFLNGSDFYVKVGNSTVYVDSIPDRAWTATIDVPQQFLVQGINPVRIGMGVNVSSIKEIQLPQPVDAVLITDQSGSMDWRIDQDYTAPPTDGVQRACNDPLLMSPDTQKLALAKCFGKEFIQIILDKFRNNRIGLVSFAETLKAFSNVTSDRYYLEEQISFYQANGGTCVSCSIQKATELLQGSDRAKAMVIMTDGCANHIIPGVSVGNGNVCYNQQAFDEALQMAEEARDQNISLFTIGFGLMDPAGLQLLQDIACLDNCSNYGHGENPEDIRQIYQNFAERIARKQSVQTKHVQGSGEETLPQSSMRNSRIEYSPMGAMPSGYLVGVMEGIGCNSKPKLPDNVASATLLSWAGTLWTIAVQIDNNVLFDHSGFGEMISIGDPFAIDVPIGMVHDEMAIEIKSADVTRATSCLDSYYLFYTARPQAGNHTFAEGCHWIIDVAGDMREMDVPLGYVGDKYCEYTRDSISYDNADAYQAGVGDILRQIDSGSDGVIQDDIREIYVIG